MADIQTDLNTIAKGKYGKDVRQAIHDAIETCYSDGKVGSIDLVARERIDNIVVSGNKELTEQTLWNGSIYGTGASASLASAITNFDYIDLYVTKEGNVSIHTIPSLRGTYIIRESNLPDDGAASFSISEAGLTFTDNSTISLYKEMYFSYENGTATGRIVNPTDTDSQSLLHLVKVVGRKSVANTEVVDLRTPAEGMTVPTGGYSTAGDAVRGQISELKSQIANSMPYAVKQALDTILQNVAFKNDDVYSDELTALHAWASAINVVSITAVYTQSRTVYNTASLEELKSDLVVTASYDDGTSATITGYTLSGTLVEGTSTISVTYEGKSASFNVTVTNEIPTDYTWLYKASDGTKLSARTDIVSATFNGSTESLSNNNLNIYIPQANGSSKTAVYNLKQTTNTNGTLRIKFKINDMSIATASSPPAATSAYGLRTQISNGTNGIMFYQNYDGTNLKLVTYEGSTFKSIANIEFGKWYIVDVSRTSTGVEIKLNDKVIHASQTYATYYCSVNRIACQNSASDATGHNTNVDVAWIAYTNND